MRRRYLGHSYDAVKRLWAELLRDWALFYAEPRFVPEELRVEYTAMSGIPVFEGRIGAGARRIIRKRPRAGRRLLALC